jgi:replicative DNA helicase
MPPNSPDDILNMNYFIAETKQVRDAYKALVDRCTKESHKSFTTEEIEKNLTGFARASLFKETIVNATDTFKNGKYESAYNWTQKKIEELLQTDFSHDLLAMDLSNPKDWFSDESKRKEEAITTGSKALDEALGGGLFRGETTAIMAPTNQGKTTALITMLRHAIVSGKRVMLFTHEGRPEAIRLSILSALSGIPKNQLYNAYQGGKLKTYIDRCTDLMSKKLTFIPYTYSGKMYVENVIQQAVTRQEEAISKGESPYDMIIDDYPKKLRSKFRSQSKDTAYRAELAEIYDEFNHLAAELNVHCLVAIQTNRAGAKKNKDASEAMLVDLEEIDESYGIAQNMANVIGLNRSPQDQSLNIVSLTINKSRNNQTHVTVRSRTDYGCSLTHGDSEFFDNEYGAPFALFGHPKGLVAYKVDNSFKEPSGVIHAVLMRLEEGKASLDENFKIKDSGTFIIPTLSTTEVSPTEDKNEKK